jgi:hypothetical protein
MLVDGFVNAVGAAGATAGPTPVTLAFDGTHVSDSSLSVTSARWTFHGGATALCSRHWADVEDVATEPLTVMRKFTCDDGSASCEPTPRFGLGLLNAFACPNPP